MKTLTTIKKDEKGIEIRERFSMNNLCPTLTAGQIEVIEAKNSLPMRNMLTSNKQEFQALLIGSFNRALRLSGHSKDVETYKEQVSEAIKTLERNFRVGEYQSMTFYEVEIAISRGVSGSYGEFHGINFKTINQFFKGYLSESNAATTKQMIYEGKLRSEREEEERSKKMKEDWENPENFKSLIERDRKQKQENPSVEVKDLGNVKCLRLISEGKIKLTDDQTEEYKFKTLEVFAEELKESKRKHRKNRKDVSVQWKHPDEKTEKGIKNKIFYNLVYNDYLCTEINNNYFK